MVSAAKAPKRVWKKRRASSNSTHGKNKKLKHLSSRPKLIVSHDSPAGRFCHILELGSAAVWEFVSSGDVNTLLQMFPGVFSEDFVDKVSLNAIQSFAVENKTHLGRQCGCDWMRYLGFVPRSDDKCIDHSPYTLDKTMPILQVAGGAPVFLHALFLTKALMEGLHSKRSAATFVPVVCPLVTKEKLSLTTCTENDVKRTMNSICASTGSRFFKEFKRKRGPALLDYLDYHWDGIDGSSCKYCTNLTNPKRNFQQYTPRKFEQLRSNCRETYQSLRLI